MFGMQASNFSSGARRSAFDCRGGHVSPQFLCQFQARRASLIQSCAATRKLLPLSATQRIHSSFQHSGDELLPVFADILSNINLVIQPLLN
jgi:hypothetical protein